MSNLADAYSEAHLETEPLERDAEEITRQLQSLAERWDEILSITATIGVDTAAATREITRSAEQWQEQLDDLVVIVTADTSDASAELTAFDSFVQEIADTTVIVNAEADVAQATADLEAATLDWEALVAAPLTASVDMDTAAASAQLAEAVAGWTESVDTITVTPGFDGAQATADIQAAVATWEALGRFDVEVGIDSAAADAKVAGTSAAWRRLLEIDPSINPVRLEAEIRRTGARLRGAVAEFNDILDLNATVDVDTAAATAQLASFSAQWEDEIDITASVAADTGKATTDLLGFANDLDFIDGQTATVRIDAEIADATAQLQQLAALADILDGQTVNVTVDIDAVGVDSDAARVEATLEALTGQSAEISLKLNSGEVIAELEAVSELLDAICAGCTIEIDVDLGSSIADLTALKAAVDAACGDQTITVDVDQRRTANPINDLTERITRLSDESRIDLNVTADTASAFPDVAATAATWRETLGDAARTTASFEVPESVFRDVLGLEALLGSVPEDVRTSFSGDTEEVVGQIIGLRSLIEDLNQKTIDVTASVTANEASIAAAAATIDGGIPDDITTTVGINIADLRARLTEATAEFAAEREVWTELGRIQTHLGVDSAEATAEMEAWHARAERLANIKADIEVQITDAITKLTAVETLIDRVDGRDAEINIDVNGDEMQRLLASLADAQDEIGTLTDAAQEFSTVLGDLQRQSRDVEFDAKVTGIPEAIAAFEQLEVARKRATVYPTDVLDIPSPNLPDTPATTDGPVAVPNLVRDMEAVASAVRQQQLDAFEKEFAKSNTAKLLNDLGGSRDRAGLLDLSRQLRNLGFGEAAEDAKKFADRLDDIDAGSAGRTTTGLSKISESLRVFRRDLNQSAADARLNTGDRFRDAFGPLMEDIRAATDNIDLGAVQRRVGPQSVAPQLTDFADRIESGMDQVGQLDFSTEEANAKIDAFSSLAHELVGNIRSNVETNTDEAAAKLRASVPELQSLLDGLEATITLDDDPANVQLREFITRTREALHFSPDVDTAAFRADLAEMQRSAESTLDFLATVELADGDMRRDLDLLVDEARFKLDEITSTPELNDREIGVQLTELATRMRERLSGIPASVDFDGADALFEADALVVDLETKFRKITTEVDLQGVGAEADAFRISRIIARLLPDRVVDVDVDGGEAVVEAGFLNRLFNRLLGKVTTTVDIDGGGATLKASVLAFGLNKILGSLSVDSSGITSSIVKSVSTATSSLRGLFRGVSTGFSSLAAPIRRAASTIFTPFTRAASATFGGISRLASSVFGGISRFAAPLVSRFGAIFGSITDIASTAFSTVSKTVTGIVSFTMSTLSAVGGQLASVFGAIAGPLAQIGKIAGIVGLVTVAVGVLGGAIAALVPLLLGLVGLTGGFLTLAAGIGLAAGAAGVLGIALNKDLLARVTDGLKGLKSVVAAITRPVGEALINNFLDPFLGSLAILAERAAPLAEAFINPIATASLNWLNTFSGLLSSLDASQFVEGFANGIGDLINTFAAYLQPFLAAINRLNGPAFAGFQALVQTILDLGLAFEPVLAQIFQLLVVTQGPLTSFGVKAAAVFTQLLTGLNGFIASPMWQQFVDFLAFAFSGFEKFLKGLVGGFTDAEEGIGGFTSLLGTAKVLLGGLIVAAPLIGAAFNAAFKGVALVLKGVLLLIQGIFRLAQGIIKVVLIPVQQVASVIGLAISTIINLLASGLEALPDFLVPDGWISGLRDAQGAVDDFRGNVDQSFSDLVGKVDTNAGRITGRLSGLFTAIDTGEISGEFAAAAGGVGEFDVATETATATAATFSDSLGVGAEALGKMGAAGELSAEQIGMAGTAAVKAAEQFKNTTALADAMREKFSKPIELTIDFSGGKLDLASLIQFDEESVDPETGVVTPAKLTKGIGDAISQAEDDAQRAVQKADFVKNLRIQGLDDLAEQVSKVDGPALEAIIAEIGDYAGAGAKEMERRIDEASKVMLAATDPIGAAIDAARKTVVLENRRSQIVFELEQGSNEQLAATFAAIKPEDLEAAIASYEALGPAGIAELEKQLDDISAAGEAYITQLDPIGKMWEAAGNTPGAQAGLLGKLGLTPDQVAAATGTAGQPQGAAELIRGFLKEQFPESTDRTIEALVKDALAKGGQIGLPGVGGILPEGVGSRDDINQAIILERRLRDMFAGAKPTAEQTDLDSQLDRIQKLVDNPGLFDKFSPERQRWIAVLNGTATNVNDLEARIAGLLKVREIAEAGGAVGPDGTVAPGAAQAAAAGASETSAYASGLTSNPEVVTNAANQMINTSVTAIFAAIDASTPGIEAKASFFTNAVVSGLNTELTMVKPVLAVIGANLTGAITDGMSNPMLVAANGGFPGESLIAMAVVRMQFAQLGAIPRLLQIGMSIANAVRNGIELGIEDVLLSIHSMVDEMIAEMISSERVLAGAAFNLGAAIGKAIQDGIDAGLNGTSGGTGGRVGGGVGRIVDPNPGANPGQVPIPSGSVDRNNPFGGFDGGIGGRAGGAIGAGARSPAAESEINETGLALGASVLTMLTALAKQVEDASAAVGVGITVGLKNGVELGTENVLLSVNAMGNEIRRDVAIAGLTSAAAGVQAGIGIGKAISDGVNVGMLLAFPTLLATAVNIATTVAAVMKSALEIRSPSRVTHEIGYQVAMGLSDGIDAGQTAAVSAAERMASAVADAATPGPIAVDISTQGTPARPNDTFFGNDPFAGGLYKPSDLTPAVHNFFDQLNAALDTQGTIAVSDRSKLDELIRGLGESGFQTSVIDANRMSVVDPRDLTRQFTLLAQGFKVGNADTPAAAPWNQKDLEALVRSEQLSKGMRPASESGGITNITEFVEKINEQLGSNVIKFLGADQSNNSIGRWVNTRDGGTVGFSQNEDGLIFKTMGEIKDRLARGENLTRDQFVSDVGVRAEAKFLAEHPDYAAQRFPTNVGASSTALAGPQGTVAASRGDAPLVNIEHMDVHTNNPEDVPDALFRQIEPAAWRAGAWGM